MFLQAELTFTPYTSTSNEQRYRATDTDQELVYTVFRFVGGWRLEVTAVGAHKVLSSSQHSNLNAAKAEARGLFAAARLS